MQAIPHDRHPGRNAIFWLIGALAAGKLALHLLTATGYGLHRDEYLYLEMGRHLAWGYKEVPPLLAPLAALSRALGDSAWAVRL